MKKNNILLAGLFLVCGFLFFLACEGDQDNPVAPGTPPENPATLRLTYNFTGATIDNGHPLIIHIYNNKNDITNQNNPLFSHVSDLSNDSRNFDNIPAGTYYILVWRHSAESDLDTLQNCERFLIWTNFGWWSGDPVEATPVTVTEGSVIDVNVNITYNDLELWGSCPQ